ncbi:MAG: isoprenylcysteine carboxylmethyltransferase family protein [Spirochaetia bacterium]
MDIFFRYIFIFLFSLLSALRWFFKLKYRVYKGGVFTKDEGPFLTAARSLLGIPLIAGVIFYVFFPQLHPWMYLPLPFWVRILSAVTASLSLILLFRTHKTLKAGFSTNLRIPDSAALTTEGPYKFIRHPMYTAYFILMLSAFGITRNYIIGFFGLSIILLLMSFRRAKEEAQLIGKFGEDYKKYLRNTPAFFPKLFRSYSKSQSQVLK